MSEGGELISGGMVRVHLEALRAKAGDAAFERALETLSLARREELGLVTPLSWIHIATLEALYFALAPGLGVEPEALHVEIAGKVVGKAVTSLWRALLNLASNQTLVGRAPLLFKRAYKQGRLVVRTSGDDFAELVVEDWPDMSEFALRGFRVGIQSVLVALGRTNIRVSSKRTPTPVLRIEWGG